MRICDNCKHVFDTPKKSYDSFDQTEYDVCPLCGSDALSPADMCKTCGEWVAVDELTEVGTDRICEACGEKALAEVFATLRGLNNVFNAAEREYVRDVFDWEGVVGW